MDALALGNDVKSQEEKDTVSKGGFIKETGLYEGVLDCIYLNKSKGGALMANIVATLDDGSVFKHQECIMSNKSGTLLPYYIDKKSGEKRAMIGYTKILNILRTISGDTDMADLSKAACEKKVVKVYDPEEKAEVPKEVTVFTDTWKKPAKFGILLVRENKTQPNPDTKRYEPINEVRESNTLDRVFNEAGLTRNEQKDGVGETPFIETWKAEFTSDFVNDRYKEVKTGARSGSPSSNRPAPADDLDL